MARRMAQCSVRTLLLSGALALGCRSAAVRAPAPAQEQPGQLEAPSFAELQAQSRRESRVPEAKRWEQQSITVMNAPLDRVMNHCREADVEGRSSGFTALVQLAADGQVREVVVSPVNPFSDCARAGLKRLLFPGYPWEGYWLEIETLR